MDFSNITNELLQGIDTWEPVLSKLPNGIITNNQNSQNRTIKQILGHMADSASNNLHRIVHLQYQDSPLCFPNYATKGNNDRWISIQHYQNEDWENLIQYWKYNHLHLIHVIKNVNLKKLDNEWISGSGHGNVSLKDMITDFLRHFQLHLAEIQALTNQ